VVEIVQRLLSLEWRRHGATVKEAEALGSRVWYADFRPHPVRRRSAPARPPAVAQPPAPDEEAPTLVLLHGLGASSAAFHPLIPRVRLGFRVVVPDLPGYGFSRPRRGRAFLPFAELLDATEAFVEQVAPRGAYLAGNSMGGWIATKLAARRPDLVRGLGLMNPGGPALDAEDWADFVRLLVDERAESVGELMNRLFHRVPLGASLFARDFRRLMRAPSVIELVSTLDADDFLTGEELERIRCPAVLLWGDADRLIPEGCRRFYLRHLAHARYVPLEDCGHCPQLEAPSRTAQALLELPCLAAAAAREGEERDGAAAAPEEPRWEAGADAATVPA
jgi:abhydrolase domain-containing protein 6